MKIGIDSRMINYTGIGRVISAILKYIPKYSKDEVIAYIGKEDISNRENLKTVKLKSKVFSINEQFELPKKIKDEKLDLFHSPQFNIPIFSPANTIVSIHDCAFDKVPEEVPSKTALMYYRFMMKMAVKKSKKIITVSESSKRDLINCYNASEGKIKVIYDGIDYKKFNREIDLASVGNIKEKFGLNSDFGLYVGLTRPRKNIVNLLKAIKNVRNTHHNEVKFVFAGKIDDRYVDIPKLSRDLGLQDTIIQTGFITEKELIALYKTAKFLALPSIYEGFGLPVLEAMASGLPVLTSNSSSLPEVAGDAAILVDPFNIKEISDAMIELFVNTNLCDKLINMGFNQVKKFAWSKCAEQTYNIYKEVSKY